MIILDGIIYSLQKFGGISTYFTHLCNEFEKQNLESEILLYKSKKEQKSLNGVVVNKERFLERFRSVVLKDSYPDNTILHSSYYRYCNNKKIKNVITIYDFIYEKFEANLVKKQVHFLQKKLAVKKAKAIICISESTKNDFLEYFPDYNPDNVFVTHLAHSSKSVENSTTFNFDKKFIKPFVLFVGMRSVHKNFIACVKSLKNLNIDLKIVGGGPLKQQERAILELNIPSRYEHLTNIDNNKLNELYTEAICLLYPSMYEGFGLPILEAMANGCAVITTNTSSLPEVAGNSSILLEDPNAQNLELAVQSLIISSTNRYYIDKGFTNVKRFSWEKTAKETIDIYRKIENL